MSLKRQIVLSLSMISFIISILWVINSGFSYEPIITFFLGLAALIGQIYIDEPSNSKLISTKTNNKSSNETSVSSGNQTTTVNVSVTKPNSLKEKSEYSKEESKMKSQTNRDEKLQILKDKVGILFIDDDTKFKVVKILKDAKWKKTKSVVDIKSLDEPKVRDAMIYFVDINGVGIALQCENEGLDIALMLKQKYPNRKVVIYSANPNNKVFHDVWDLCDYKLEKNALPYQFQSLVEEYSLELEGKNLL